MKTSSLFLYFFHDVIWRFMHTVIIMQRLSLYFFAILIHSTDFCWKCIFFYQKINQNVHISYFSYFNAWYKENDAILKLFGVILGTDVLVSWFWPVEMCQYKARKKFKFASVESPLTFVGKIPKTSEFWANISCLRATIELEKVT